MKNGILKSNMIYTNTKKKKQNAKRGGDFNVSTYDSRLKKIKSLTISVCNDLYINLHDVTNLLQLRRVTDKEELNVDINQLLEDLENYIENLNYNDDINLEDINKANDSVDERVTQVYAFVAKHDSILAEELKGGIVGKIKKTGLSFIFNEKKMQDLADEKNYPKFRASNREINEGKAITAMFSNCYSPEVRNQMIDALKPVEQ